MALKRRFRSRKTGQIVERVYGSIGGKPSEQYFRDKMRDHRRKRGIKIYSNTLSDSNKVRARELHASGMSQHLIAKELSTTRYRIQTALGLR